MSDLKRITASSPNISSKFTTIETTTPLLANAVFNGSWHDSNADGTNWVDVTVRSDQTGNITLQESDDFTDPNFTITVSSNSYAANNTRRIWGVIRARYWRIVVSAGITTQTSLKVTSAATNIQPFLNGADLASGNPAQGIVFIANDFAGTTMPDAIAAQALANSGGQGNFYPLTIAPYSFNGLTWDKQRAPSKFFRASPSAAGNTAIWTPAAGKKFRLLAYDVDVTEDVKAAVSGDLVISFQDATTDIGIAEALLVPASSGTAAGAAFNSGWSNLGPTGILSALANNVLNVNLSFAITAGLIIVKVAGVEE